VGADEPRVAPLSAAVALGAPVVGNKAANLARLGRARMRAPDGFCITVHAYSDFVRAGGLVDRIRMEIGRKALEESRWEELWDAAHRIRAAFLSTTIPEPLAEEIRTSAGPFLDSPLAVRSSAPGEDSATRSHAGLHESVVDVRGEERLLRAVRVVWASLWSDAALLYRRETGLDPRGSRMAVVVQRMVEGGPSGVAFSRDPRDLTADRAVVEAVPGPCRELVDGEVDPDRYTIRRTTGDLLDWRRGDRPGPRDPLLEKPSLAALREALDQAEDILRRPADIEWTFGDGDLDLLQARPITPVAPKDEREWYLTLRPGDDRLRRLARDVGERRIPELAAAGERLASADLTALSDADLASEIEERARELERWRRIYRDEFIPFAHGVRRLAVYYQEAVRPEDPYEFVGLLTGQELLAQRRNRELEELGATLRKNGPLRAAAREVVARGAPLRELRAVVGGAEFVDAVDDVCRRDLDLEYAGERLGGRPELVLHIVLEMRERGAAAPDRGEEILRTLLDAVGPGEEEQALEVVEIGRLSWRLRDDDNLLMGRLESQLLRAIEEGTSRLAAAGRLTGGRAPGEHAAKTVSASLRDARGGPVRLPPPPATAASPSPATPGEKPRQLVGQPSSPGLATGAVRLVRDLGDLARFRAGDVLVCDAIQPSMTHVVPLASAVVERRGGMLIHGAIIARELGIPCVNGIPRAAERLEDGETVTVDGWLGIVTVGEPELDLERNPERWPDPTARNSGHPDRDG
jgi:phosphohistidine swiveling domain-containing protein